MLGQILLARGLICPADLQAALEWQQNLAGEWPVRRLGSLLIKAGVLTGSQVADALAAQRGEPVASGLPRQVDPALRGIFPLRMLIRLQAVPVQFSAGTLVVALVDPHKERVRELRAATEYEVQCVQAPQLQVYRLLRTLAEEPRPAGQGMSTGPLPSLRWTVDLPERRPPEQIELVKRAGPGLQLGDTTAARARFATWLVALAVAVLALLSIGVGLRLQGRALGHDTVTTLAR